MPKRHAEQMSESGVAECDSGREVGHCSGKQSSGDDHTGVVLGTASPPPPQEKKNQMSR